MQEKRVITVHNRWKQNKEWNEERVQFLQEKRKTSFFGLFTKYYWKTIDSEIVPQNAWLQKSIFGDELTGWKSKFSKYI